MSSAMFKPLADNVQTHIFCEFQMHKKNTINQFTALLCVEIANLNWTDDGFDCF